jgi:hypothetical protein
MLSRGYLTTFVINDIAHFLYKCFFSSMHLYPLVPQNILCILSRSRLEVFLGFSSAAKKRVCVRVMQSA